MAFLYITEYARQARDSNGLLLPAGEEPALAYQRIDNTGVSVQSAALNVNTAFVRLHTDSICSFKIGVNPTAVVGENRMADESTEFFGVPRELVSLGTVKVAAVLNT